MAKDNLWITLSRQRRPLWRRGHIPLPRNAVGPVDEQSTPVAWHVRRKTSESRVAFTNLLLNWHWSTSMIAMWSSGCRKGRAQNARLERGCSDPAGMRGFQQSRSKYKQTAALQVVSIYVEPVWVGNLGQTRCAQRSVHQDAVAFGIPRPSWRSTEDACNLFAPNASQKLFVAIKAPKGPATRGPTMRRLTASDRRRCRTSAGESGGRGVRKGRRRALQTPWSRKVFWASSAALLPACCVKHDTCLTLTGGAFFKDATSRSCPITSNDVAPLVPNGVKFQTEACQASLGRTGEHLFGELLGAEDDPLLFPWLLAAPRFFSSVQPSCSRQRSTVETETAYTPPRLEALFKSSLSSPFVPSRIRSLSSLAGDCVLGPSRCFVKGSAVLFFVSTRLTDRCFSLIYCCTAKHRISMCLSPPGYLRCESISRRTETL